MTGEEMQEKIEFIIQQHATFSDEMDRLAKAQQGLSEWQREFRESLREFEKTSAESTTRLDARLDRLSAKIDTLVELQAHADTRVSRLEEGFALLVQTEKVMGWPAGQCRRGCRRTGQEGQRPGR